MDRIELIRRLNGVLLDEMARIPQTGPPGSRTTCDLRCITKKYRRRATSPAKKTPDKTPPPKKRTGQMPSPLFLLFASAVTVRLSSHSEAVSPEKALWNLLLEDLPANGLKSHPWVNCTPVRMQASTRSYVTNRKPSHRLLHRAGSRV